MKIIFAELKRTNLGFPSEWKGKFDNVSVVLSFRQGRLKLFLDGAQKSLEVDSIDEWDISGYLSDEDLIILLKKNDLLAD